MLSTLAHIGIFTLVGSLIGGALVAQEIEAPERFAPAAAILQRAVTTDMTPGAAIAVLEDNKLVWAQGFGFADVAAGRAATADTPFALASISKPFTATVLAQLWQEGKVDLDVPVNRYLQAPGVVAYQGRTQDITLRRLLNHTAGLPTHWNFFYEGAAPPPPREDTIAAYGFAAWPPGSRTNYSNLAFGIIDHVIARSSGNSFRDELQQRLLTPLGMTHTGLGPRTKLPTALRDIAVRSYRTSANGFEEIAPYGFDHDGASAVWSSARDLMTFAKLQIGRGTVDGVEILDTATAQAMRDRRGAPTDNHFGMAWRIAEPKGHLCLGHTGGMPGVSTVLRVFPDRGCAVAVLCNGSARGVATATANAVIGQLLTRAGPGLPAANRDPAPTSQPQTEGAPKGKAWRGFIQTRGPVPFAFDLSTAGGPRTGSVASLAGATHKITDVARRESSLGFRFRGALPATLGPGPASPPLIEVALERSATGMHGVAYATRDGVCRLPYWVAVGTAPTRSDDSLRIISYNVLVGFADYAIGEPYLEGRQRRSAVTTWISAQQPDVVALQEANGFTEASLHELAEGWGHSYVALLKETGYPPALTSRYPIEIVQRRTEGLHHGLLWCRTAGVDFVVVHVIPHPGMEKKRLEVESILGCYNAATEAGRPVVLLGDFNSIASADVERYSEAAHARYRKWNYLLDGDRPAEIAADWILEAGAVDAVAAAGELPAKLILPRIDFVFGSPDLPVRAANWWATPEMLRWSDHPPVVVDYQWTVPGAGGRR